MYLNAIWHNTIKTRVSCALTLGDCAIKRVAYQALRQLAAYCHMLSVIWRAARTTPGVALRLMRRKNMYQARQAYRRKSLAGRTSRSRHGVMLVAHMY